jgi:hypothetical protein
VHSRSLKRPNRFENIKIGDICYVIIAGKREYPLASHWYMCLQQKGCEIVLRQIVSIRGLYCGELEDPYELIFQTFAYDQHRVLNIPTTGASDVAIALVEDLDAPLQEEHIKIKRYVEEEAQEAAVHAKHERVRLERVRQAELVATKERLCVQEQAAAAAAEAKRIVEVGKIRSAANLAKAKMLQAANAAANLAKAKILEARAVEREGVARGLYWKQKDRELKRVRLSLDRTEPTETDDGVVVIGVIEGQQANVVVKTEKDDGVVVVGVIAGQKSNVVAEVKVAPKWNGKGWS